MRRAARRAQAPELAAFLGAAAVRFAARAHTAGQLVAVLATRSLQGTGEGGE